MDSTAQQREHAKVFLRGRWIQRLNRESTERADALDSTAQQREHAPVCGWIQRLNRESTERGSTAGRVNGMAGADGFNGSTERALKVEIDAQRRQAWIQRLNRESTESREKLPSAFLRWIQRLNRESTESAFRGRDFWVDGFNGSTERALKDTDCSGEGDGFNGSTERALKSSGSAVRRWIQRLNRESTVGSLRRGGWIQRLNRESTESSGLWTVMDSTAQQRSTERYAAIRDGFNGSTERALKAKN